MILEKTSKIITRKLVFNRDQRKQWFKEVDWPKRDRLKTLNLQRLRINLKEKDLNYLGIDN